MAELVRRGCLDAFLATNGALPWRPGEVDCCMVLASWAMWLGYADPVAEWRGTYSTEAEFEAIVERCGGVLPLVSGIAATVGAIPCEPHRGCIGVVGSRDNIHRQFGTIHDGSGWLVRQRDCFARITARTLAAWKI